MLNERYVLEAKHIDELKALEVPALAKPSDFWLLQQTEDEVLDYHGLVEKYQGAYKQSKRAVIMALLILSATHSKLSPF